MRRFCLGICLVEVTIRTCLLSFVMSHLWLLRRCSCLFVRVCLGVYLVAFVAAGAFLIGGLLLCLLTFSEIVLCLFVFLIRCLLFYLLSFSE